MKFLFLSLLFLANAFAHEYLETATHMDVYGKARELSTRYRPEEVLIVFDIDNTLLKAKQVLGSDQWFEWQAEAIKTAHSDAAFKTFDELLAVQADFFQLSSMALTEPATPNVVKALKGFGHNIVLLTSRGPNLRNVTERELQRNGLWFADKAVGPGLPYEYMEPPFKLKVSYMNGIFMTSGHHKGEALAYLIQKSGRRFKAVIFADDHERHTKRVYETFVNANGPEIITYRYGREDAAVQAFKTSPKSAFKNATVELVRGYRQFFKP